MKCLKRAGLPGGDTTMKWEGDGAWRGELTTHNTGECPNAVVVSRLSQILEETPHPKYSLTAKACQGILRRAERRGKDLPKRLKAVLIRQSQGASPQERTEAPAPTEAPTSYAVRIGGGCDGGGKGDPSPTLTDGDRHGVMCMTPWDAQSQRVYDGNGVSPTLSSRENSGLNREAVLCAGFKAGQGAQAGGIGYGEEVSPTLAAVPSGTNQTPAVVVLDMTHACDVIRECGERVPSLQARMGTGGNQVPLVAYGIGNGQANEASVMAEEVSQTLNTMHDVQAILYQPKSAMEENWAESETKNALRAGESKVSHAVVCEDVSHALRANAGCAYREDAETYPVQNMVVRRLTPLECERLQGFPDGWTDIGDYTDSTSKKRKTSDSARYKALGNSIALPFWRWMLGRMAAYLPEGATLGSLFDGIGGFPLCWENIHGAGTAIWASEIEEFPIAVTKLRFGGAIT